MEDKKKKVNIVVWIFLVIIVLLIISSITFLLINNNNNKNNDKKQTEEKNDGESKKSNVVLNIYYNSDKNRFSDRENPSNSEDDLYELYDTYKCKTNKCHFVGSDITHNGDPIIDREKTSDSSGVIIFDDGYYHYIFSTKKITKLNIEGKIDIWETNHSKDYYFLYKNDDKDYYAIYDYAQNKRISDYIYLQDVVTINYDNKKIDIFTDNKYNYHFFDVKNKFKSVSSESIDLNDIKKADEIAKEEKNNTNYYAYKLFFKCNPGYNVYDMVFDSKFDSSKYSDIFDYLLDQNINKMSLNRYGEGTSIVSTIKEYNNEEITHILNGFKNYKIINDPVTISNSEGLKIEYNNNLEIYLSLTYNSVTISTNDANIIYILDKEVTLDNHTYTYCQYKIGISNKWSELLY